MAEERIIIVRRVEIKSRTLDGEDRSIYAISYKAPGLPLRTIFIPKSKWNKDLEKKMILEDIEKYKAAKPEVI